MKQLTRQVLILTVLVALAAVALSVIGGWVGLAGGVVLAATGAWQVLRIVRFNVEPIELAAGAIEGAEQLTAAELAARLASEHRRALEALAGATTEARRREAALGHTSDAVVIVRPDGIVEYANPTARMFLQDRTLESERRLSQPDLERLVERAATSGEAVAEDVTLWIPGAKYARARAVPLADGAIIVLLSDLSESYRLDRVRRDFVANVSHELKTPVAAIRALAETAGTALAGDDHATAVRFVERLGTEATRLAGLVTDLLDLSRVEVGAELEIGVVPVNALLAEAADRARAVAEVKEIELVVHDSELTVDADPSQIAMAVKNLVDNAVRYSERGKVELGADRRGDWIALEVSDQGIGIPSDELKRIFERFYRVDKARSRATGGTGLGLAIVRHVIENHGGTVEVHSELGVGSTFTLLLPADNPLKQGIA